MIPEPINPDDQAAIDRAFDKCRRSIAQYVGRERDLEHEPVESPAGSEPTIGVYALQDAENTTWGVYCLIEKGVNEAHQFVSHPDHSNYVHSRKDVFFDLGVDGFHVERYNVGPDGQPRRTRSIAFDVPDHEHPCAPEIRVEPKQQEDKTRSLKDKIAQWVRPHSKRASSPDCSTL